MSNVANHILLLFILLVSSAHAADLERVSVYTDQWTPYVNPPGIDDGPAQRIVQLVFREMGHEPEWEYLDYYFSYRLVRDGDLSISFPYFKTEARNAEVLFSSALMSIKSGIFYSTQNNSFSVSRPDLSSLRAGRVAGYSYGESLEFILPGARVFDSERAALTALANGDIDLLPMSIEVGNHLIQQWFPHRMHEFSVLDGYSANSGVHLIASPTEQGKSFITQFNKALDRLTEAGVINEFVSEIHHERGTGYVRLVAAEGFPVIAGYRERSTDSKKEYFIVPQGSRASVLYWDPTVLRPHDNEKIYDGMMGYSQIHIIDGPHAGKRLWVRNMHLSVE